MIVELFKDSGKFTIYTNQTQSNMDKSEKMINDVLSYMKSLPRKEKKVFAEELIYATLTESGDRYEVLGILSWAEDTYKCEYKQAVASEERKLNIDRAIVEN